MLNYISKIKPNVRLIGYDIDEDMINKSKQKYPNIYFTDNWDDVINMINTSNCINPSILLSSVIHEVYSYSKSNKIKYFWNEQVFNNIFKYVIIRDMIPSTIFDKMNSIDINKIRDKSDKKYLNDFQNVWGNIDTSFRTMLHWLLKYKYIENWDRELRENYLPITIEYFKKNWIPSNWKIIFEDHYTYDYIKKQIKNDFDINLNEPTHLKMIIKRN